MNHEEAIAWAKSLKPGDKVIGYNWPNYPCRIITITKVTPSGIVRTDFGSYKVGTYGTICGSFGDGGYAMKIGPYNDADAESALRFMAEVKEARRQSEVIRRAKVIGYAWYSGNKPLSYEQAEAILKLAEEANHENSNSRLGAE